MKRAICVAGIAVLLMGLIAYVAIHRIGALRPHPKAVNDNDTGRRTVDSDSISDLPLHFAIRKFRHAPNGGERRDAEEMIASLIAGGADVNANDDGDLSDTPLHMALGSRYSPFATPNSASSDSLLRIARQLVEAGADVNAKNALGLTPFHYAVQGYPVELVALMIAHGADVNVQCPEGWSPLHCAVSAKAGQVVDLLIRSGADVNTRLKDGTTPLDLAEANGYDEIAASLRKHGAKSGKEHPDSPPNPKSNPARTRDENPE